MRADRRTPRLRNPQDDTVCLFEERLLDLDIKWSFDWMSINARYGKWIVEHDSLGPNAVDGRAGATEAYVKTPMTLPGDKSRTLIACSRHTPVWRLSRSHCFEAMASEPRHHVRKWQPKGPEIVSLH